jgi:hypothetical protein
MNNPPNIGHSVSNLWSYSSSSLGGTVQSKRNLIGKSRIYSIVFLFDNLSSY